MSLLQELATSPLGVGVSESGPVYYGLLAGHAIGMGVVVGTVLMLAIRVLGFRKDVPLAIFDRLFRIAWCGFFLNAATGVCLFAANGPNLVRNGPFLTKLSLIALGGVAVLVLSRTLSAEDPERLETGRASAKSRVAAVATLTLWCGAIVAGRLIAYTIKY